MFSSQNSQVSNDAVFVEDVFSTFLYTGNGTSQTITNGIDLAGKGGLVWFKNRGAVANHLLLDSARGSNALSSNTTGAEAAGYPLSMLSTGFTINDNDTTWNASSNTYASWTFREQPKFFDVVTYTGDGVAGRQIAHNLGSAPGCIIIKNYSGTDAGLRGWGVWHRTLAEDYHLTLNSTAAQTLNTSFPLFGKPAQQTSTYFTVGQSDATGVNAQTNGAGLLYVAYLFAHDAGGFGLTGTDNVISCGSYTGNGSTNGPVITLGYEPQWVLIKRASGTADWNMLDTMRGIVTSGGEQIIYANSSGAEFDSGSSVVDVTATGFKLTTTDSWYNSSGNDYIYIAIRRGPMKVPTSGTSVLGLNARSGTSANATVTGGAGVTDLAIIKRRNSTSNWVWTPRLAGTGYLSSNATTAETAAGTTILQANPWDVMDGIKVGTTSTLTNASGSTFINYLIDRAPSFMDVVCYTGTGATINQSHNLGVPPELIFFKSRSAATGWRVIGNIGVSAYDRLVLQTTAAATSDGYGSAKELVSQPTSSVLSIGTGSTLINSSGVTFVAYLFATCAGVSKVGSYTGNGSTQTINCGFTGGARFVLIKNTSAVENWQIFDTARGMVAGTDPELRPNTTDTEVNVSNMVYTATTGFELVTSNAVVNGTGNSYIFLAIA